MDLKKLLWFFLCFQLLTTPPLQAGSEDAIDLPPLDSDVRKIEYLLAVKKQIPKLFSDAATFDIHLLDLAGEESQLLSTLKTDPRYVELFKAKQYHQITVTPPREGLLVHRAKVTPEAVTSWKAELEQTLAYLQTITGKTNPIPQALLQEINPPDETTALKLNDAVFKKIKSHPTLLKLYNDLPKDLPQRLIQFGALLNNPFETSMDSLDETSRAELQKLLTAEAMSQVQRDQEKSQQKQLLAQLLVVLSDLNLPPDASPSDRQTAIRSLTGEDLSRLNEADQFNAANVRLGLSKEAAGKAAKRIKTFAEKVSSPEERVFKPVTLSQVVPPVGVFRGCVGGDCSSKLSFPYPNDPHERVFFIQGDSSQQDQGTPKGYVSCTEVQLLGRLKGLYVHTVSGSGVTEGTTELILNGLEAKKKELGVDFILLPTSENLPSLLNFEAPKAIYQRHIQGRPELIINYQDHDLRRQIQEHRSRFNVGKYDSTHTNRKAVPYGRPPGALPTVQVKTEKIPIQPLNIEPLKKVPPADLVSFLIDLHHSNREEIFNRTLDVPEVEEKINESQLHALLQALKGPQAPGTTVQQWQESLVQHLSALQVPADYLQSHSHLLYPGITQCSDAFSPRHVNQTSALIVKSVRKSKAETDPQKTVPALSTHWEAIRSTDTYRGFMREMRIGLQASDNDIKTFAAKALKVMKPTDRDSQIALLGALSNTNGYDHAHLLVAQALAQSQPIDLEIQHTLVKALEDGVYDTNVVLSAIKPSDPTLIAQLSRLLQQSPHPSVRQDAAQVLGAINPPESSPIRQALVEALKDSDDRVQQSAASALGKLQPMDGKTLSAVTLLLKSLHPQTRKAAADALGFIRPHDPEVHRALANALSDPDETIRRAVMNTLGALKPGDPNIHQALAGFLKGPATWTQSTAIQALGEINPHNPEIHHALAQKIAAHYDISDSAIEALQKITPIDPALAQTILNLPGYSQSLLLKLCPVLIKINPSGALHYYKSLLSNFQDHDYEIGRGVVQTLTQMKPTDPAVLRHLTQLLLKDPNLQVRVFAAEALQGIQSKDPTVHQALASVLGVERLGYYAAKALAESHPTDEATQILIVKAMANPQINTGGLGVKALGEIHPTNVALQVELAHALKSMNLETRKFAAESLAKVKPANETVQAALAQVLNDPSRIVRRSAAHALELTHPTHDEVRGEIIKALKSHDPEIKAFAKRVFTQDKWVRLLAERLAAKARPRQQDVSEHADKTGTEDAARPSKAGTARLQQLFDGAGTPRRAPLQSIPQPIQRNK
jgi:HEAT repeat protein